MAGFTKWSTERYYQGKENKAPKIKGKNIMINEAHKDTRKWGKPQQTRFAS